VISIIAGDPREALEHFSELSGPAARMLAPMLAERIAAVVQLGRMSGAARILEILEVDPEYEGAFSGQVLFMLDPERNRLEWRKLQPQRVTVPAYPSWELR